MRRTLHKLFAVDPRSLAALRIGLASLLLADLVLRARALEAHYTADGVMPARVLREMTRVPLLSLHLLNDSWGFQLGLFVLAGLSALLMLLGRHTRWATILCLVLTYSLHVRNPLTVQHSDLMLYALLLWCVFLPLEGAASMDGRYRPERLRRRSVFSVASAGLVLQGILVYLVTSVAKLQYPVWLEGRALFVALNKTGVARATGEWLLDFPELLRWLTHAALAVELLIPLLALSPWRTARLRGLAIVLSLLLQAGIFTLLDLDLFQPTSVLLVIPWLPAAFWNRFPRARLPDREDPHRPGALERVAQAPAAALLALVLLYNAIGLIPSYPRPPRAIHKLAITLRLDQRWRMFSAADGSYQGWHVVAGRTAEGEVFDLQTGATRILARRPSKAEMDAVVPNNAWMVYWRQMHHPDFAVLHSHLADYFCRRWNAAADGRPRVVEVEILYMDWEHYDPRRPPSLEQRPLVRKHCPED